LAVVQRRATFFSSLGRRSSARTAAGESAQTGRALRRTPAMNTRDRGPSASLRRASFARPFRESRRHRSCLRYRATPASCRNVARTCRHPFVARRYPICHPARWHGTILAGMMPLSDGRKGAEILTKRDRPIRRGMGGLGSRPVPSTARPPIRRARCSV
jgi:hypothetical protein